MIEKIKFYTDEHVPTSVVKGLERRGIDVLTTQKANMISASDEEHLAFAVHQGRVIFTQDDDFLRLHSEGINHAGIAYARQQTSISVIIRGLTLIFQVLSTQDMRNHVEFL